MWDTKFQIVLSDDIPFLSQESVSSGESEMSTERTPSPTPDESISPKILENVKGKRFNFILSMVTMFYPFQCFRMLFEYPAL